MDVIYKDKLKRVQFSAEDSKRLATLRELLQKQSADRLTDSDVLRRAVAIALTLTENTK